MGACYAHPGVAATGTCDACQTPICMRCTKGTLDGFMCPPCAHKRYGRRKLVTGLKVAGLTAGVVAVAVVAVVLTAHGNDVPKTKVPPPRDPDPVIASLLADRDVAPCDRRVIRNLCDALGKADRYAEVIDAASGFFARCGPFPRLEWSVVYALQQLGRYAEATKHETVIIEDDPFDSDYWWWRGEDRARARQPALALADYRQSIANSETSRAAGYPGVRVLDVVEGAGRPCEGWRAMRYLDATFGEVSDDQRRRADGLRTTAGCDAQDGRGALRLVPSAADASIRTTVQLGGVTGSFVVDPRAGTTAVAAAFAARAQVVGGGAPIQTVAMNVLRTGVPATVALAAGDPAHPATVAAVEVAIVDGLPAGVDGVLGLSFLWAFPDVDLSGGVIVSDAPPP